MISGISSASGVAAGHEHESGIHHFFDRRQPGSGRPNGSIWGSVITNITGSETRRVDMTFSVDYGDDMEKAEELITEIVLQHPLVLKDPEPTIRVNELADSSVNIICRPWAKTSDYWTVHWDILKSVKKRFDAEGISIPFPQQDIRIHHIKEP